MYGTTHNHETLSCNPIVERLTGRKIEEAKNVLNGIHGKIVADLEIASIEENIKSEKNKTPVQLKDLLSLQSRAKCALLQ